MRTRIEANNKLNSIIHDLSQAMANDDQLPLEYKNKLCQIISAHNPSCWNDDTEQVFRDSIKHTLHMKSSFYRSESTDTPINLFHTFLQLIISYDLVALEPVDSSLRLRLILNHYMRQGKTPSLYFGYPTPIEVSGSSQTFLIDDTLFLINQFIMATNLGVDHLSRFNPARTRQVERRTWIASPISNSGSSSSLPFSSSSSIDMSSRTSSFSGSTYTLSTRGSPLNSFIISHESNSATGSTLNSSIINQESNPMITRSARRRNRNSSLSEGVNNPPVSPTTESSTSSNSSLNTSSMSAPLITTITPSREVPIPPGYSVYTGPFPTSTSATNFFPGYTPLPSTFNPPPFSTQISLPAGIHSQIQAQLQMLQTQLLAQSQLESQQAQLSNLTQQAQPAEHAEPVLAPSASLSTSLLSLFSTPSNTTICPCPPEMPLDPSLLAKKPKHGESTDRNERDDDSRDCHEQEMTQEEFIQSFNP